MLENQAFDFIKVKNVKEAISVMKKNPSYAILAGGTDLIGNIREGMISPKMVIDIKEIAALKKITWSEKNQTITIGALVTYNEFIKNDLIKKHFPLLSEAATHVASAGVRNRATMVGNICSAVPCLDAGSPLMVYEGEVQIEGSGGKKSLPMKEWILAPRKTAIEKNELVTAIKIKKPAKHYGSAYYKLTRYEGEDLAQATCSVLALPDDTYKIAFGSVAPTPVRALRIEEVLNGKPKEEITTDLIAKIKDLVELEIKPITDIRASKEFRMHMSKVMLERTLLRAIEKLIGKKKGAKP